jgi:hypothetical protein
LEVVVFEVDAVDEDGARRGVVEALEQRHDGGFAAPARAHEGDELAGLGDHVDAAQHAVVGTVGIVEAHGLELNFAREVVYFLARRAPVVDFGDAVEEGFEDGCGFARFAHVGGEGEDGARGLRAVDDGGVDDEELEDCVFHVEHEPAAVPEDEGEDE